MTIRALHRNVFCRVCADEEKVTAAGLFLPQNAKGRPDRAAVVAVPEGYGLKVGDVVGFDAYRIKVVMEDGALANAHGSPVANPGDLFVIDVEDILYVEE